VAFLLRVTGRICVQLLCVAFKATVVIVNVVNVVSVFNNRLPSNMMQVVPGRSDDGGLAHGGVR
jgi:hypothetical protein